LEGSEKRVGRVKDIFYIIKKKNLFILNGKRRRRRGDLDGGGDFDGFRIVEQRMERARDFMKMLMTK
jgi:hypothetical protein